MKALLEQESQGVRGVAGMAELQEDRQCNFFFGKNNIIAIILQNNIAILLQYCNNFLIDFVGVLLLYIVFNNPPIFFLALTF